MPPFCSVARRLKTLADFPSSERKQLAWHLRDDFDQRPADERAGTLLRSDRLSPVSGRDHDAPIAIRLVPIVHAPWDVRV